MYPPSVGGGGTGLSTAQVETLVDAGVADHVGESDPHTQYLLESVDFTVTPVASNQTTTDNSTGATATLSFAVTTGRTHLIEIYALVSTGASTNGARFSIQETGGATSSHCHLMATYTTSSSSETSSASGASSWTAGGTMPTVSGGGSNTATLCKITVLYVCTASGTATLWFRPESAGGTMTVYATSTGSVRARAS